MSNKKITIIGSTAAAALIAAAISLFGGSTVEIAGGYQIEKISEYKTAVTITVPEELPADVYELWFDGSRVSKELLPNGITYTHPLVLTDFSKLEIKLYKTKEAIASAFFEPGGYLRIIAKDGVLLEKVEE